MGYSRLDNVREGFNVRREIQSINVSRLVIDYLGFGVVGHGKALLCFLFLPR